MNIDALKTVTWEIVARQKGVLAADESSPTMQVCRSWPRPPSGV